MIYLTFDTNIWIYLLDESWQEDNSLDYLEPPFDKDKYKLMFPHYERAILHKINLKGRYNEGLISHLVAFYFWGHEGLNNGLLALFFEHASADSVLAFVNFIWRQKNYTQSLDSEKLRNFEKIIVDLWQFLATKYTDPKDENEGNILSSLSKLTVYISVLNENNTALILKSCQFISKNFYAHELVQKLNDLTTKGRPNETAKYIGQILSVLNFDYLSDNDKGLITSLVTFLYENNQHPIGNELCDEFLKAGHEFLRGTRDKYNS